MQKSKKWRTNLLTLLILVLFPIVGFAQLSDLARIDYTLLPSTNNGFTYEAARVLFNYPIKLKEGTYLFVGVGYANVDLTFGPEDQAFDKPSIDSFQIFDFNLGYTFKLENDWRFAARFAPGLSSNLSAKRLTIEDAVLSGELVFIKDQKENQTLDKPYRLIFGVSYSGNRGFPFPLPFISYYRKFHPKWSYNLGVPKTNIQYHISEKHRLKLNAELDGFTANIQNGILLNDGQEAESINMSLILASMQYEFHFWKYYEFFFRASYILDKNVNLRNIDRNNILSIDDSIGTYFRSGIRFKI